MFGEATPGLAPEALSLDFGASRPDSLPTIMVCIVCKQKEAKVHYTELAQGQVKKIDLCEACAKEKGLSDPTSFNLADILLGLGASQEMEQASESKGGDLKCPACGFTQADFKKSGRLGCSECYNVFSEGLASMLKTMHKGTTHKGKVPQARRKVQDTVTKLAQLERDLQAAIQKEDFEQAAVLRDQIKAARSGAVRA